MTTKKKQKKEHRILHWRGVLADQTKLTRVTAFAILTIAMVALTFTQLGFVGLGTPGNYTAYGVVLLAPIALAALLFGLWLGTLFGLLSGITLLVHASQQPLDYYEIMFITPVTSLTLFTFMGFLLGLMFAIALRKNPSTRRSIIYVIIVCFIASVLFTVMFTIDAVIALVVNLVEIYESYGMDMSDPSMESVMYSNVFIMLNQLGDIEVQFVFDFLLMAVTCVAFGLIVRRMMLKTDEARTLTSMLRIGVLLVVLVAFMLIASAGFAVITEQGKQRASENMEGELAYLVTQLDNRFGKSASAEEPEPADDAGQPQDDAAAYEMWKERLASDNLLEGYDSESDGLILFFADDKVVLANNPDYKPGMDAETALWSVDWNYLSEGKLGRDELVQIVCTKTPIDLDEASSIEKLQTMPIATDMGYMRSAEHEGLIIVMIEMAPQIFSTRSGLMVWLTLATLVLMIAVFLLVSNLLDRVVVRRIAEINGVLGEIMDGNLDAHVDITDSREFKSLSNGINTTVDTLKEWIAEAETRMDSELAAARAIQESALPRIFPPFPDILRFDIYASMHAAREVGGDFYDFFLIDGEDTAKLGFVIADVSGKGVPAALFMMAAKTQIRNFLNSGVAPGEAIENANRQLCEGNESGMFVTVFAGVLDYETGRVEYVNAGHNPPLLWHRDSWEWLKQKSGLPLGLFDGFPYETFEIDLGVGDQFLLYTDGVTEAMDVEGRLYGEERLMDLVAEFAYLHPRRLLLKVRQDLVSFTDGAEQSDDITMLALEYGVPPEVTATLVVPADVAELPHVLDFVHTELDRRLCPVKAQKQLDIALEELFVNVAHYAYPEATPDNPGMARVSYTYSAEPPSITVELSDDGIPYNPLAKPDAVTPDDIMEVPIGGLGILMAKKSVDEMSYEYLDGCNIVTFRKTW